MRWWLDGLRWNDGCSEGACLLLWVSSFLIEGGGGRIGTGGNEGKL